MGQTTEEKKETEKKTCYGWVGVGMDAGRR